MCHPPPFGCFFVLIPILFSYYSSMSKRNKRERISYKQADDFVSDFDSGVENDDDSDDQVEYKPRSRPKAKTTKSKKKQPTVIMK